MPEPELDTRMCAAAGCARAADCFRHADSGRTPAAGQAFIVRLPVQQSQQGTIPVTEEDGTIVDYPVWNTVFVEQIGETCRMQVIPTPSLWQALAALGS